MNTPSVNATQRRHILIIGPAWVGDMVMAQSLFKLIKIQDWQVVIDVLAPHWSLPLLKRMPEVNNTHVLPFSHGEFNLRARWQLGRVLRKKNFDEAIVLPNSFKSALPVWVAKIPKRTGWRGEMRYGLLNDLRILDKKRYGLMIERFMALALPPNVALPREYPLPELMISKEGQETVLQKYQLSLKQPILALCPGAEFGPAKRWPAQYFADVAKEKIAEGWQVWLLGSQKDQDVTKKIAALTADQVYNLAGHTSLEEAVDLLSLATAVVSNDSGLMHIAAALKKRLIVVYGPTSPHFTPPLHADAKILQQALSCQPCFQRTCPLVHQKCMTELPPNRVLGLLNEVRTCS